MADDKRLIEVAFPLRQASIDSVHEKNVRHGHISTLHIWPARRPLAACRAALIATLLPDPGDKEKRDAILERLGGTLKKTTKKKKMPNGRVEEIEALETEGGILHWGRESAPDMDWFRDEIRKAFGGRAPKVLDPFAGGGAIPLEAMRLGCDVTAMDINPVAWFILKCTLEYPQKLAGQTRKLPDFAVQDPEFMAAYFKAKGLKPAAIKRHLRALAGLSSSDIHHLERGESLSLLEDPELNPELMDADLAWHVRAWGRWVLRKARKELARYYPTYAELCSLKPYRQVALDTDEPLKLVPTNDDGEPQIGVLNAGFDQDYLENPVNPRWIAKPTVAYLWARTVRCKSCRATLPLLKTRWLVKKDKKRALLTVNPKLDGSGVEFGVETNVQVVGGNAAQRREHDKRIGEGTMSRSGATCPCCKTIMTSQDLRLEGQAERLGVVIVSVVVDGPKGKEYRLPMAKEIETTHMAERDLPAAFSQLLYHLPKEEIPFGASRRGGGSPFTTPLYGLDQWWKLFTPKQLLSFALFSTANVDATQAMDQQGYSREQQDAIFAYLVCSFDRMLDFNSCQVSWITSVEAIGHTFVRYALPITWDYSESATANYVRGGWRMSMEAVCESIDTITRAVNEMAPVPRVICQSAIECSQAGQFDVVVTDPPYYDAIPYSDLMDYFYVWDRRQLSRLSEEFASNFEDSLGTKWSEATNDGELIDDSSRFDGDTKASKRNYEAGMARAFGACHTALKPEGRLVIVFAHKQPDAWETLVAAIIEAGFVVDGSWPIQTEQAARMRAQNSAALSSSVWLVCRKREPNVKPGWDAQVLKEMETNIVQCLRDFWDAGIRGPDFVWAATGPALEPYSRYPAVRKASEQGAVMGVNEFLGHVRRIVVDFVVGRVLTHGEAEPDVGDHPLDDVTTYYLLHRADFGVKEAPAGPCILYAISCGLSERELVDQYALLTKGKGGTSTAPDEIEDDADSEQESSSGSGGKFKLTPWKSRTHRGLGEEPVRGRAIPLIDHVHRLMQLWVAADAVKVDAHLDRFGLRRSQIFAQLIQALIEQSRAEGNQDERSIWSDWPIT